MGVLILSFSSDVTEVPTGVMVVRGSYASENLNVSKRPTYIRFKIVDKQPGKSLVIPR